MVKLIGFHLVFLGRSWQTKIRKKSKRLLRRRKKKARAKMKKKKRRKRRRTQIMIYIAATMRCQVLNQSKKKVKRQRGIQRRPKKLQRRMLMKMIPRIGTWMMLAGVTMMTKRVLFQKWSRSLKWLPNLCPKLSQRN